MQSPPENPQAMTGPRNPMVGQSMARKAPLRQPIVIVGYLVTAR
jgi:hypothetical protein